MKDYRTNANYRTDEQFEEIIDSCLNGNWTYAIKECVEYGFFAQDLINKQEEFQEMGMNTIEDIDLCILSEGAEKLRNKA
jgi:hypothetical protein